MSDPRFERWQRAMIAKGNPDEPYVSFEGDEVCIDGYVTAEDLELLLKILRGQP